MIQEFIPYQQALELKKLGFDEPCFAYYDEEDNTGQIYEYANCSGNVTSDKACYNDDFLSVTNSQLDKYGAFCSKDEEGEESYERWTAPTYSQAFRFFREKYGYLVSPFQNENNLFFFEIGKLNTLKTEHYSKDWETYEDAEISCLVKLIEIIKNK
jgi:hypothetical protein